jgi:hypothetical protein
MMFFAFYQKSDDYFPYSAEGGSKDEIFYSLSSVKTTSG